MDEVLIAQKTVSTAEGTMYGAGDEITGPFDPDAEHNALLIEEGLISRSTTADAAAGGDSGSSTAKDASDTQAAAGGADGGDASSATVGDEMKPRTRGKRK